MTMTEAGGVVASYLLLRKAIGWIGSLFLASSAGARQSPPDLSRLAFLMASVSYSGQPGGGRG